MPTAGLTLGSPAFLPQRQSPHFPPHRPWVCCPALALERSLLQPCSWLSPFPPAHLDLGLQSGTPAPRPSLPWLPPTCDLMKPTSFTSTRLVTTMEESRASASLTRGAQKDDHGRCLRTAGDLPTGRAEAARPCQPRGHPSSFGPFAERGQASRSGKDGVWSLAWPKPLKRSSQVWEQTKDQPAVALWWTLGSCRLSHISK